MGIEVEPFIARLHRVIGDRKPYPWGSSVGLTRGAIHRLLRGQLPDPERLLPLVRTEGLSLSWLLTGQGTPYVVHVPATDAQGADLVRQLAEEMEAPSAWLIANREAPGSVVAILSEHVSKAPAEGDPYEYEHAELIGGPRCGALTAAAVADSCSDVRRAAIEADQWRRLASGYMSLTEVSDYTKPGLYAVSASIQEASPPYIDGPADAASDLELRMLQALRRLPMAQRETMVRMVEAAAAG